MGKKGTYTMGAFFRKGSSKKRWEESEKRVADLEKTQSQQSIEEAQKRFDELIQKCLDNPNRLKF